MAKDIKLTYPGLIEKPKVFDTIILDELMKKFQSGKRYLRERIFEGYSRKEAVDFAKPLFLSNSRYMRDAFLEAEATISSQKELLPLYVQQYELKIVQINKQIERLEGSRKRNKKMIIDYKRSKLKKLIKSKHYFQHHIENGTVPKMVDGTRARLKDLKKQKITKEEWRDSRSNALYSRGEKSKGGNENMRLSYLKDNLFEIAVLNPMSSKKADRLVFQVRFPEKMVVTLVSYLETKEAYSVRIKRRNGTYEVHVTLEAEITAKPNFENGVAGMDINPNNLSVSIIYPNGNFKTSKVFWMHEVNDVSANKREHIIQHTLYDVFTWIQSFGIDTLVIENLKFLQKNEGKKFNRMSSNFSFRSIITSLLSVAFKTNMALIQVEAYYSSLIGKVKYQQTYGLSVHQAAAFVLARRGMGFEEKVPKELLLVLFTKEVKKGQKVSDLFKHWKKVKEWHDTTMAEIRLFYGKRNRLFLKDLIQPLDQLFSS